MKRFKITHLVLLSFILAELKITGVIFISWWLILLPIYIIPVVLIIMVLIALLLAILLT